LTYNVIKCSPDKVLLKNKSRKKYQVLKHLEIWLMVTVASMWVPVTMAWPFLRLQMEKMVSRCGG
jgi:hypothetical protein